MDDFERELKVGFLDEAAQSIADCEQCFLSMENNPDDVANLNQIFRLAHNLKGSSKAVGFSEFGAFTHEFESFILRVKNHELKVTPKVMNLLLRANDFILHMISELKQDLEAKFSFQDLLLEMKNFTESDSVKIIEPLPELNSLDLELTPEQLAAQQLEEELSRTIDEAVANLSAQENTAATQISLPPAVLTQLPPLIESPPAAVALAQVQAQAPAAGATKRASASGEESIRVGLAKVEELLNFVGEMVILQSVLREQVMASDSVLMKKSVAQLGKVSKEIQDLTMGLRMVPLKPTFQKMQRIVRDTSQDLGKDVKLHMEGENTELDKTVLELMNDPLVHLIRNAVDHGIESPEARLAKGKPAQGTVALKASRESGKLVIYVIDDGGGMDPAKLRRKAVEKGLLKSENDINDKQAYQLIFAPGFSTKEQVSDVSGRGVGMDVVKTNIQELGGEIFIESELGKGSTFKVMLPLTLAIIDGMILNTSGERFVLPLNHVFETLKPDLNSIQNSATMGELLLLRGENMPLIRMGDLFGMKSEKASVEMIAIVIRTTEKPFALLVDDIIGQFQVVVKQLGPELVGLKGVTGTTILGDGKPALILEPQDLIKRNRVPGYVPAKEFVRTGEKAA
jgi:two-component system chemotaxis sensor kinase CheA